MKKKSAGLVMYRFKKTELEIFLVHPGGPFWKNKDEGTWSIPKGEYSDEEDPFEAAQREFKEETGCQVEGNFFALTPLRQPGRKLVSAWAFEGDCDETHIVSNMFTMIWPPESGRQADFPEVDKAAWFSVAEAKRKILKGQIGFIEQLCQKLDRNAR